MSVTWPPVTPWWRIRRPVQPRQKKWVPQEGNSWLGRHVFLYGTIVDGEPRTILARHLTIGGMTIGNLKRATGKAFLGVRRLAFLEKDQHDWLTAETGKCCLSKGLGWYSSSDSLAVQEALRRAACLNWVSAGLSPSGILSLAAPRQRRTSLEYTRHD